MSHTPPAHNTLSPYLVVRDASAFVAFMAEVLGAVELGRLTTPDGKIGHCEVRIGDTVVMVGDQPDGAEPSTAMLHVYVPDVDACHARALAHGAVSTRAPADQFYGDRTAMVTDSWGVRWAFATHLREVSMEEMQAAVAKG